MLTLSVVCPPRRNPFSFLTKLSLQTLKTLFSKSSRNHKRDRQKCVRIYNGISSCFDRKMVLDQSVWQLPLTVLIGKWFIFTLSLSGFSESKYCAYFLSYGCFVFMLGLLFCFLCLCRHSTICSDLCTRCSFYVFQFDKPNSCFITIKIL